MKLNSICLAVLLLAVSHALAVPPAPDGDPPYEKVRAVCAGDQFQAWTNVKIDGREFFISPTLDYPAGSELNHFRLKVEFSGEGTVEVGVAWHTSDKVSQATAKSNLHRSQRGVKSGQEVNITCPYAGRRFVWVYVRGEAPDVKIKRLGFEAWIGKGTIYGHVGHVYQYKGGALPYRLLYPRNYDPEKKYPLVISGHGSGGAGKDNRRSMEMVTLARYLFTRYWKDEPFECFSLVPQIPSMNPAQTNVPDGFYPKGDRGGPDRLYRPDWPAVNARGFHVQATLSLVEELIKNRRISIDADRIYYGGFSYGGKAIWEFLKAGRETFAGGVSVAGWPIGRAYSHPTGKLLVRLNKEARRYKHIPVAICAGGGDRMRFGSKAIHEVLQKLGAKSRYIEFEGVGHIQSAGRAWGNRELIAWLFKQRRSENPDPGKDPFPAGQYDE
jgi:predicted esterase